MRRHYATMSVDEGTNNLARSARRLYRSARLLLKVARYSQGRYLRTCTVCGYVGKFSMFGIPPRLDAQCTQCLALERHRHLALLLAQNPDLVHSSDRVLHFAPEPAMTRVLQEKSDHYESADIVANVADLKLDVTDLNLPADSRDVVVASHVLEHVDDQSALREIYRVLSPNGRLIAMVPFVGTWAATFEDSAVLTPEDRERVFGQVDHVRIYGNDCKERIKCAGFDLRECVASPKECLDYGIERGSVIFVATKPT